MHAHSIRSRNTHSHAARVAFINTLPVFAGYLFLGIGFGVILRTKGYGLLWAFFMSISMYSGSMQYLAVDLLASGATALTAGVTTLMVNARHLFYGISVVDLYRPLGWRRYFHLFTLTDETYALICGAPTPRDVDMYSYFTYVSLFDYLYWIFGCCTGSVLGAVLPFSLEGIDFSLTALFVSIFVDQWCADHKDGFKAHIPALTGVLASLACLLLFGADQFIIPSMLLITVLLLLENRKELKAPKKAEQEESAHD